jgi:hypothetical protein
MKKILQSIKEFIFPPQKQKFGDDPEKDKQLTNVILKYQWHIFVAHLSQFHPLSKEFISKYEYELNWKAIANNKVIEWDIAFLEKYEKRFLWFILLGNEAIMWTEEKIEKFKDRIDWWHLSLNKNLPITEEFLQKYKDKIERLTEVNPLLTKELKEKYNLQTIPKFIPKKQKIISWHYGNIAKFFTEHRFPHPNQDIIYKDWFLPIINSVGLEKIFEDKFDYTQRYYYLKPLQLDFLGLTPIFEVNEESSFDEFREDKSIFELKNSLTLKNGASHEGQDRLYEVLRFRPDNNTLLISENIKSILEQFKLPNHIFHPVNIVHRRLKTDTQYFILHLEHDRLTKDLDFAFQTFYYNNTQFIDRTFGEISTPLLNYDDFEQLRNKTHHDIFPQKYILNSDYDMYSYSVYGHIIVNQYLKNILERNFPNQMLFESAQLLSISIDQTKYEAKAKIYENIVVDTRLSYEQLPDERFYWEKVKRLKENDIPIDISILESDKFTQKQIELNVIFPADFKHDFLKKKIELKGDYYLLGISKFYTQNDYADKSPETYKSVVIAENGFGDSINLILEKESDIKLQYKLFEFLHETGEYQEV